MVAFIPYENQNCNVHDRYDDKTYDKAAVLVIAEIDLQVFFNYAILVILFSS